jgi:hypothetical protein
VVTPKIAAGVGLVMAAKLATRLYVRQAPAVEMHAGGTAEFIANQRLVRAEERLALAVPRPAGIVKITGMN